MKLRRLAALTLVAAAFAAPACPAFAAEWAVGANIGNVPWKFQDAQGQFVGFKTSPARPWAWTRPRSTC